MRRGYIVRRAPMGLLVSEHEIDDQIDAKVVMSFCPGGLVLMDCSMPVPWCPST